MNEELGKQFKISEPPKHIIIGNNFKPSNWTCYMFGSKQGNGIAYTPSEGKVPNIFVRWMMKICFDCTWVKK